MKYLRAFSIMVSCFVAAASVQAMNRTTEGESSEVRRVRSPMAGVSQDIQKIREISDEETLGDIILRLGVSAERESDTRIHDFFGSNEHRILKKFKELGSFGSESATIDLRREMGEFCISRDLSPILEFYEEKIGVGNPLTSERDFHFALDYISILARGIGVSETQRETAKSKAYGLIRNLLDGDSQQEESDESIRYSQFHRFALARIYFFMDFPNHPDVSVEVEKVRRVKEKLKVNPPKLFLKLYNGFIADTLAWGEKALQEAGKSSE